VYGNYVARSLASQFLTHRSSSPPAMPPGDLCHHPEGWGPVSRIRPFDFTPCFEDAVLFSVPLGLLITLSLFRLWHLSRLSALHRTQRINTWLLWAKLVRVCVSACPLLLLWTGLSVCISLLSDPRSSLGSFCQPASSISALPLPVHKAYIISRRWFWRPLRSSFSRRSRI
jgi:hypothetical protein